MAWYVTVLAAVMGLCAAAYGVGLLRDALAPRQTLPALVEKRYRERFPLTIGLARRDRQEYHLCLKDPDGRITDFRVGESLYALCPAGTAGTLTRRGRRLLRFEPAAAPANDCEQGE